MNASRMHSPPTPKATQDQFVRPPTMTIGIPARAAIWNAPPIVPPMKAEVLKKSALATLTSRTSPDDWRVNRSLPSPCDTGLPSSERPPRRVGSAGRR